MYIFLFVYREFENLRRRSRSEFENLRRRSRSRFENLRRRSRSEFENLRRRSHSKSKYQAKWYSCRKWCVPCDDYYAWGFDRFAFLSNY
jgi:molecular chaperone GrpE (heat shock protein)